LEPCGGVGRHAINIVSRLATQGDVELSLLFSRTHGTSKKNLPINFPLRDLPFCTIPTSELLIERCTRLFNWPKLDTFGPSADWYYSPMEGMLPTRFARNAITMHDVALLETSLPWSNTLSHLRARQAWLHWAPKAARAVDKILTVSQFSKGRIVDLLGTSPDRVHVVGNGVDDKFFQAGMRTIGKVEKQNEVIVLGGLRYKKGADWVLRVADELHHRNSPLTIVAIGQHDANYIYRAKAHPKIEVVGMLADSELIPRLTAATALMLLSHYEGFGIPPLEAMAAGTPAIVANRASLPEVVGDAGIVVDPEQSREIAALLDQLHVDAAWRRDVIIRGQQHATAFTWEKCVDRLRNALR
jgi:glycosyltransferase involved in cell wall biosynthesis